MEDEGRDVKGKHQSFVENATAAAAAFGTNANAASIFKILAGRKALKCPCEEYLVNSAPATTRTKAQVTGGFIFKPLSLRMESSAYAYDPSGKMPLKRPLVTSAAVIEGRKKCRCEDLGQSFVENPSATTGTTTNAEVTGGSVMKPPCVDSSAYVYAAPGLVSDFIRVRGRRSKEANKLFTFTSRRLLDPNRITTESMPWISGRLPPQDLREILKEDPFYKKAVASGLEVKLGRCWWFAKAKEDLF